MQTTTLQLSKEKAEEQQKYLQLKHRISLSLIERFSWVNKLGDIYIDADMSLNKSWESIFSRIKKELHVSAGRNLAKEIEHTICEQQPQLWIEFESLGLIPSERTMLLFLISGISTRVIRELTGKTEASIYNMKTRIKNKLRQSDSPFALCVIEKL